MNGIRIIPVGEVETGLLDGLAAALAGRLRLSCHVNTRNIDPSFAWDQRRDQFWSTAILKHIADSADPDVYNLAITEVDLFVPVLTYVFGEAQLGGTVAVVSLHRLRNEFYGLPADAQLLRMRLCKEAMHELGHNFGLRHCGDWQCVMTSSHAVEKIDVKNEEFCSACARLRVRSGMGENGET